jgi:hypothetical protein
MLVFKAALYIATLASAFFFGGWEFNLRRRLTEEALEQQHESVSDYSDITYGIKSEIRRELILRGLPREELFKMRVLASLKFLFIAILVIEVIFLQR